MRSLSLARWYLRLKFSFRFLMEMMAERGIALAHTTVMRWIERYVPEFEKNWNRFVTNPRVRSCFLCNRKTGTEGRPIRLELPDCAGRIGRQDCLWRWQPIAERRVRADRVVLAQPALDDNLGRPRPTPTMNGSISFGNGAGSTARRWLSPTRTHGSSGPRFEKAKRIAPLSEGLPRVCETTEK